MHSKINPEDIIYLLASYLIVVDGDINSKELSILYSLYEPPAHIRDEHEKIINNNDTKLDIDRIIDLSKQLGDREKNNLFRTLFELAFADGYCDVKERDLIESIRKKIDYSIERILVIESEFNLKSTINLEPKLNWIDSIKVAFDSLIYELKEEKDEDDEYELLTGNSFVRKIKQISRRAEKDLFFAEKYMTPYNNKLQELFSELENSIGQIHKNKRNDDVAAQLVGAIDEFEKILNNEIKASLEDSLIVLDKKRRTVKYFTIAFMGRTKAGKSTLHKVITHDENDDIGVGKLRTTRHNRSWEWENLRIVDTPGIGAPGGKTDTETAKTIIDEADIVCYVVINDSIQDTEFVFLKELKERNKPLFIILNIKENLEHPLRFQKFIQDPLKWRKETGRKSIVGHYERVMECLKGNYDLDSIEIIPIQLLAAQLADVRADLTAEEKKALIEGSNLKEYVYKIKQSIYQTGSLKKTQNIIDGCNYRIYQTKKSFQRIQKVLLDSQSSIRVASNELQKFIREERKKTAQSINEIIDALNRKLKENAKKFAEEHYAEKNNKILLDSWNRNNEKIYNSFNAEVEQLLSEFSRSIEERIKECLFDLSFQFEHMELGGDFSGSSVINKKLWAKITLGIIGTVVIFFTPAGWVLIASAVIETAVNFLSGLFRSKLEEVEYAKKKMFVSLEKNIDKHHREVSISVFNQYNKYVDDISLSLDESFDLLLRGICDTVTVTNSIISESQRIENTLNGLFVFRILQHLGIVNLTREEEINLEEFADSVVVERIYEKSILNIKSSYRVDSVQSDELSRLLQTKINFK